MRRDIGTLQTRWPSGVMAGVLFSLNAGACLGGTRPNAVNGNLQPKLATDAGGISVVLPQPLVEFIHKKFPGYRIPLASDLEGAWAGPHKTALPFVAWGDYTDDRLTDVAIILLGPGHKWQLVAFNQTRGSSYESFVLDQNELSPPVTDGTMPPKDMVLETIKKGQKHSEIQQDSTGHEFLASVPAVRDTLSVGVEDWYDMEYTWIDGQYQKQEFGPE